MTKAIWRTAEGARLDDIEEEFEPPVTGDWFPLPLPPLFSAAAAVASATDEVVLAGAWYSVYSIDSPP